MNCTHTIILVTQDDALSKATQKGLSQSTDYRVVSCDNEKEVALRLDTMDVDLIIFDADMAKDVNKNILIQSRISHSQISRVVVSSVEQRKLAQDIARSAAAYLVLLKPVFAEQLLLTTKRALELNELSRRHRLLSRELKISMDDDIFSENEESSVQGGFSKFERMVYVSPKMADLVAEAKQAAITDLPVLISGETGTGKELLARAIQYNSLRMDNPMLVQNCGGMSDDTLHSELFGHVKGAFSGSVADRLGLFRAAEGGTVFLDEISDISPSFQVSLLRFLQEGEVKPLGSDKMQYSNVRILAATNRPLKEMVERGEFRRDLYYRLKGFELRIPSLRERPEDIPVLTDFFIEKYAGIVGRRVVGVTKEALSKLEAYHYPGNIRELETEIRRMIAIAEQGGYISARHLPPSINKLQPRSMLMDLNMALEGETLKEMVESMEKRIVEEVLNRNRWNQSQSAQDLGLSRVGLANKIKRYDLQGT